MIAKPRRPWLAALLTVLTPGLGHLYSGHPRRGASMLPVLWTALGGWVLFCLYIEVPILRVGSFLLVAAFYVWILVDAVRLARRAAAGYELRRYNRGWVYAAVVLIAAFALQPAFRGMVGSKIARAYSFPGTSMLPTLEPGDLFYMSPRVPSPIRRGSLVVWRNPQQIQIVRRAVALPGDTVEMRAKALFVNGRAVHEPYVMHIDPDEDPADPQMLWQRQHLLGKEPRAYRPTRDTWGPLVIPAEHYLLLGDNRDNSHDGRYGGLVRREWITGRPVWVYASRDPESGRFRWSRFGMSREWITGRPVWVYASRDPESGRFRWSRFGMSIR